MPKTDLKGIMKVFNVVERTVRRWNDSNCPRNMVDGKLEYDVEEVAKWRLQQWTKES